MNFQTKLNKPSCFYIRGCHLSTAEIMKIIVAAILLFILAAVLVQTAHSNHLDLVQKFNKYNNGTEKLSDIWSDCSKSSDSVKILGISVTPDPPQKGQKITADVKLEFTEEVEGGRFNIVVKYQDYIKVMDKKKDICNIPDVLEESCPIQPGVHDATFVQKFPSYALSGTYVGTVIAKDNSGNEILCIKLKFTI